jgi:hypothetical protein
MMRQEDQRRSRKGATREMMEGSVGFHGVARGDDTGVYLRQGSRPRGGRHPDVCTLRNASLPKQWTLALDSLA